MTLTGVHSGLLRNFGSWKQPVRQENCPYVGEMDQMEALFPSSPSYLQHEPRSCALARSMKTEMESSYSPSLCYGYMILRPDIPKTLAVGEAIIPLPTETRKKEKKGAERKKGRRKKPTSPLQRFYTTACSERVLKWNGIGV